MNEEVINDLYNNAVSKGYKKSREEFVSLLQSNDAVMNDMYSYVQSKGYKKGIDDFKGLIGANVESPMAIQPVVEEPKKKEDTASLFVAGGSEPTKSDGLGALAVQVQDESILTKKPRQERPVVSGESTKVVRPKDAEFGYQKQKAIETPLPQFVEEQLSTITPSLIGKIEENVVPQLKYQFAPLGFNFKESSAGDFMIATSPSGESIEISLDITDAEDRKAEADKLNAFLRKGAGAVKNLSTLQSQYTEANKKILSQKELDESLASINAEEANIMARNAEFVKTQNNLEAEKARLESVPPQQRNNPEYIARVNDFISRADQFSNEFQTFIKDAEDLTKRGQQLNKSIGKYTEMKAQQGTWYGAAFNAVANKSIYDMAKGMAGLTIDFLGEVIPATGLPIMSQEDYEKNFIEQARKEGVDITEGEDFISLTSRLDAETIARIENRVIDVGKKNVKGEVIGYLDKASKQAMEASGVSPEYYRSIEETFVGGALLGALSSIPAMAGGPVARTVLMSSQVMAGLDAEMANDPAFADVSENEKLLVKAPIAVAVGILENRGLSNLLKQKGFLNGLVLKALGKVGTGASYKTFGEVIKNEIDSAVGRGALTLGAGFLAEAETGALQEITNIGAKELYNMVKEKEMFDTPDSVIQFVEQVGKASLQEGIGAGVLAVPGSVSAAYRGKGFLGMDDAQFAMFEKMANDSNIEKGFVARLKSRINSGEITSAEGKEILDNYNNSVSLFNSLPDNLDMQGKKEAMNLLKERRDLENQIAGKDQALTTPQRNRITQINEQLTKLSEDAIQEQAAGQVPVQPGTGVSQEVAQGEPQAEPQITPEESIQEEIIPEVITGEVVSPEVITEDVSLTDTDFDEEGDLTDEGFTKSENYLKSIIEEEANNAGIPVDILLKHYNINSRGEYFSSTTPILQVSESNNYQRAIKTLKDISFRMFPDKIDELNTQINNYSQELLDGYERGDKGTVIDKSHGKLISALDNINDKFNQFINPTAQEGQVQEEVVTPQQIEKQRADLDMEVKALEELLDDPNQEPLFKKSDNDTKFGESADVVEDVVRQINELPSGNVTTTITPKPQKPINIDDLESRADVPVKRTTFDVIKGIPAVFSISDQLRIGNVTNPNTGNVIDRLFGGLGFGFTKGHEGFAWANTTKDEAQSLVNRAVSVYNNNKALFDDWWAKNPEYNGLVPLNIAKMAEGSIMSNEALYRVIKDNFASFPKKNKVDALNYLTKNRIPSIIDSLNNSLKNPNLAKNARKSVEKRIKALTSIQDKIKSGKVKSIDQLLDPSFYLDLSLPVRAELISQLTTGSPNKPGEQKASGLPGKNTVPRALLGIDQDASVSAKAIGEANLNKVSLSNAVETITEPSMRDVEPRQIIAIYGIDVLNPSVKETVHPNYKFGVNGRPIGVLENSVSIQEAYPFAYTNILESLIAQEEKAGAELKAAPIESLINEKIPVGIGLPNLEFIGAISQGVMSNAQKLSAWINKSFPSVIMSTDAETFANVLNSEGVRVQLKGDEVVYGVTVDGDIYINPDVHNSDSALFNTTIHEFGHVWLNFLETTAEGKRLLNRGVDLVKKTGEYQDQLKKFNGNQNKAANEALAILIGNRGETIVNASLKSKFQEWLLGMWKYVKDKFKLSSDLTPQEIQDLTLDQFLGTAIADLFSGKALPVGDIQLKKLKNPEAAFSKSDSIDSIVQRGRANGFSEESIKIVLQKRGFTQEAIDAALGKAEPAAKKVEVTEEFAPGYNRVLNNIFGIIAKSRERNRPEEGTLENAINYLGKTRVYENATDVQREAMVRNLRKEFNKREKAAPSAEKVIGKPKKKQVTVDEMAALKDQIKLEARAAREAKGDLNTKRKALAAAINKLADDGRITAKKAETIAKRALTINLDSEVAVNKFIDYVSKVFADADYASKLSNGNTIRRKIRKASKNKDKSANLRDLGVKFSEIDPSMVEDIDQYNEIADKILKSIEGSSLKSGVKFAEIVKISDVSDYINTTIEKQRKEILKGKIDEMSELLGIEITEEEYFKIIESINNNQPLPKKYKDGAIRKAIDRAFNVYSAIIDDIFKTGKDPVTGEEVSISDKKKKIVNNFMSMDLNLLSDKEALAAIDSLMNFLQNGSTAKMSAIYNRNLGEQNAIKLDKKGFKSFKLKKYFSPGLAKVLVEQFTQLDLVIERMFKGFTKAGDFMFEAGISALKKGKSLAQSLNNKIVDNYFNTFYKSKPNGQAFNTIFNTVERGMTAYMMRTTPGTEAEINSEFKKKKGLIEQSIDTLKKGNDKQKELSDVYTEVYDKLVKGSENYDDVVGKADPKNVEAVRFWQNEWANKYEDLSDLSESIYNKTLGSDLNYTPVRVSNIGDGPKIDENSDEMNRYAMSFHTNNQTTYQRETGVLMTPTLDDKLSKGAFIDLSFDTNNANSMYDALIDLNTADAVRQIAGFFNSDSFENIIQNADDRGILKGRVNLFIRNIRNKTPYDNDQMAKAMRTGLQNLAALGAGRALAGPTQALKQTLPVIMNTISNAGRIDLTVGFNKDKNDFINNSGYAIANRSAASTNQIESINKLADKAAKSLPSKIIDPLLQLNELQLKIFLQKPDAYVARASWMSYYEKSLRQQGIDTKSIDYATHQINDKAADYAQRMVDRQQNLSDMDLAGKFVGSKFWLAQFINKTVMPFSSFRINQSARLGSDWAALTSKVTTDEDRWIAARSLGGFFVELATFRAVSATIAVVLASVASLISGREDDEEDRDKLFDMIIKGSTTSTIIDIVSFLPYMDDIFQSGIATSLDIVQDMLEVEDADKFPFYDPKDKSWVEGLGMLGITVERTKDLINLIDVAYTRDYKDDFGRTKYITQEDADILKNFVLLNILSSVGLASPEIKTMTRRTLANVKRRSSTNKSGIKQERGSGSRSGGGGGRAKTINKSDLKKYFPELSKQIESATGEVDDQIKEIEKEQRELKKRIKDQVYGGKD